MLFSTLLQLIVQGFIGRDIKDAQVPAMIEKLEAWYVPGVDHRLHSVTSLEGSCLSGALKVVPDTLHMAVVLHVVVECTCDSALSFLASALV